jgi:ABC-type multidrug transport system fused ATPase/permease subunit
MLGKLSQQSNNIALNSILILQKLFASMGSDFIILVLGFGLIARLHWIIAAFIFAEILLRLIWFRFNFRNMIATNRKTASAVSEIHGATTDTLGGGLSVRAFGGRLKELFLLNGVLKKYEDNYQRHVFADRKFWAPLSIMEEIFFVVIAGLCVWFFYQGSMDLGQVVFAIGTFVSLNSASWNFVFKWTELFESGAETAQNYTELVRNISVHDKKNPAELIVRRGRIKFDDIDFSYESRGDLVLSDFYLNISPGEHIGLVGQSGGGKSTIIKLLLRMYDVCGGKITIDGQDISAVSLDSLRRNISYIPQDTALFNRSILDNLKYANESATKSEVIRAARFAGAHDFIMQQPNGYNTVVGDRGVKLSGGQRQRIAIARAFLQNAPIILIDEATSSLDSETEGIIQQSLEYISSGKTMLVVAHRLATLMKMDRIIVLGNGRIVESGTHEQLIKQRGAYASMWKKQTIQK